MFSGIRSIEACNATIGLVAPDNVGSAGRLCYEERGFNLVLREFFHHYSSDFLWVLLGFVDESHYARARAADRYSAYVCSERGFLHHFVAWNESLSARFCDRVFHSTTNQIYVSIGESEGDGGCSPDIQNRLLDANLLRNQPP